jgi:hypothetical protein
VLVELDICQKCDDRLDSEQFQMADCKFSKIHNSQSSANKARYLLEPVIREELLGLTEEEPNVQEYMGCSTQV